jgi:hypothetical protein
MPTASWQQCGVVEGASVSWNSDQGAGPARAYPAISIRLILVELELALYCQPRGGRDDPYPSASCRSCRPNAPFVELVCLSKSSVTDEYYAERCGNRWRQLVNVATTAAVD